MWFWLCSLLHYRHLERFTRITILCPAARSGGGVKEALSNPDNYVIVESDDAKMTASYNVKHSIHVSVTGAIMQRTNHVTLTPKGGGCEMQVDSIFSGMAHNDQGDFKKRVDESMVKLKATKPPEQAKPADPAKPTEPAEPSEPAKSAEPAKPATPPR